MPSVDPEWQEIASEGSTADVLAAEALDHERMRCVRVIADELDRARAAGVPETSAAVRILLRVKLAIENG